MYIHDTPVFFTGLFVIMNISDTPVSFASSSSVRLYQMKGRRTGHATVSRIHKSSRIIAADSRPNEFPAVGLAFRHSLARSLDSSLSQRNRFRHRDKSFPSTPSADFLQGPIQRQTSSREIHSGLPNTILAHLPPRHPLFGLSEKTTGQGHHADLARVRGQRMHLPSSISRMSFDKIMQNQQPYIFDNKRRVWTTQPTSGFRRKRSDRRYQKSVMPARNLRALRDSKYRPNNIHSGGLASSSNHFTEENTGNQSQRTLKRTSINSFASKESAGLVFAQSSVSPLAKNSNAHQQTVSTARLQTNPRFNPINTGNGHFLPITVSGFIPNVQVLKLATRYNRLGDYNLYEKSAGIKDLRNASTDRMSYVWKSFPGVQGLEQTNGTKSMTKRSAFSYMLIVFKQLELKEDVLCLALFLGGHKYFGFDPRKGNEITWRYRKKGFYASFPRPRLKQLHSEVVAVCGSGAVECLRKLTTKARESTILKNTACAAKDKRPPPNADAYYPFKSAVDLFPFSGELTEYGACNWTNRETTASYYMCWHTLNRREFLEWTRKDRCLDGLKDLQEPLGNQKRVLDTRRDNVPFQCARLVFCPDPCYGRKTKGMVPNADFMKHKDPGNPCRALKDQTCQWLSGRNSHFEDLQRNRFNISCQCEKERPGFAWDSKYHLCVDVDECMNKTIRDRCGSTKRCQNTVGGYQCLCRAGYLRENLTRKCEEHVKLPKPTINYTLLHARQMRKMMQPEGSGTFLKKQLESFLGLSRGCGLGSVHFWQFVLAIVYHII